MAEANGSLSLCSEDLKTKLAEWLKWDKNEKTRAEIEKLVAEKKWDVLQSRLCNRLTFGTAGLRGVMRAGFDSMNDLVVIQTAQGLAKYLLATFPKQSEREKGIVLGFDGRHNSERFAQLSACVFLSHDIPVHLFSKMVPTPFIPFTILHKGCLAGVMVTASHNPKDDNGYKVYWTNGAQIISPHDKMIQKEIMENLEPAVDTWSLSFLGSKKMEDPYEEIFSAYFSKVREHIPKKYIELNEKSDAKFVYSAMHGVGFPFLKRAFEEVKLPVFLSVAEQQNADPEFPTVKFPNPEEGKSSLLLAFKLADKNDINVILANDPDADRLACAERNPVTGQWKVFSGNELGALLGWWSVKCFKENNPEVSLADSYVMSSTVSSKILNSMSKRDGFNFVETLTGFKWMGNKCAELIEAKKKVIFAFEEAIGFMISPAVLDKDGISAACHLATLYCFLLRENLTLEQKLNELYEEYGYHYSHTSYFICYDGPTIKKIFDRIRNYNNMENNYPTSVCNGKYKITSIRDLTTGIDTSREDRKALLPVSASTQMITFQFENGTIVTLRTSGTEPKIKYYAEICAAPKDRNWNEHKRTLSLIVSAVIEEFLEPTANNLIPKSD